MNNQGQKYFKSMNTVGSLPNFKRFPIIKTSPSKKISNNFKSRNNYYIDDEMNYYIQNNKGQTSFLSRVMSHKKFRNELDAGTLITKDPIMYREPEEIREAFAKKLDKINKSINKKDGCAKLVIEKIESQFPSRNEGCYVFTNENQKRFFSSKDSNNTQNLDSPNKNKKENKKYKNHLLLSHFLKRGKNKSISNYKELINTDNSLKKNTQSASTNNIYNSEYHFYKGGNTINDIGYSYKNNYGYIKKGLNKDLSLTAKSPEYIRMQTESINPKGYTSMRGRVDTLYPNDSNELYSYNKKFLNPNKINSEKYNYLYKNNNNNNITYNNYKNNEAKKLSLYENYKDLMKMNTFNKLSKNNYYNNDNNSRIINIYPGYRDKLIKIQSFWRGSYVRELMDFYWNFIEIKKVLNKIFKNYIYDYFIYFIYKLKNYQKSGRKSINNKRIIQRNKFLYNEKLKDKEYKSLDELKKFLIRKEDYDTLLKNYNELEEKFNELQQIINDKNKILEELNLDNNKKNITNILTKKKFDIIEPEQQDIFNIIQKYENINNFDNDNDNINIKLKARNSKIGHFKSNLSIINTEQFLLEKTIKNLKKVPLELIEENQNDLNFEIKGVDQSIKKQDDLSKDNINENKEKNIIIFENERFYIFNNKDGENIDKTKNRNNDPKYTIINNESIFIKRSNIQSNDEISNINDKIEKEDEKENNSLSKSSNQNKLVDLNNKDPSIFTEKAKKNIMKIILPIRLKAILRKFIHRSILPLLFNNLKKKFESNLNKVDNNITNDIIEENGEKASGNIIAKKEIKNILNNYAIYKWNYVLYEFSKEIIINKDKILEKRKNKQ